MCATQVREVYERAIANVPPAPEKRYWQRYIYLWIKYALWEELEAEDADRARQVYKACLNLIPHSIFTFAKVSPSLQTGLLQRVKRCPRGFLQRVYRCPGNAAGLSAVDQCSPHLSFA